MLKALETKAALKTETALLKRQIKALKTVIKNSVGHDALVPIVGEKAAMLTYLTERKAWNFNFEGGGWNSNHAYTKEESYKMAKKEYKGSKNCVPKEDSFRVATSADTEQLMSMFY